MRDKDTRDISIMQEKNRDFSILKKKIMEYIDFKGISKYELYQKTGISNDVLSQKNGLSEENLLKFLNCFGDISLDWLLLGNGEMLRNYSENQSNPEITKSLNNYIRKLEEEVSELKKENQALKDAMDAEASYSFGKTGTSK